MKIRNYKKQLILYFLCIQFLAGTNLLFAQPVITSFLPWSGTVGSTVVIKGTNFSNISTNNIIFFGPVRAAVNWATTDSLSATVPPGATYDLLRITVNTLSAFSVRKFLPVTNNGDTITTSSFATRVNYTTPNFPASIAIADIDADGRADIITGNYGASNLSVFRNTSTSEISLSNSSTLATPNKPGYVKAGDIDGDGKPDLVTANDISQTVSVFLNTTQSVAAISFAAKQDFVTGMYPVDVAIGDIDNDGKIDLIEINNQHNTVSVLRNTGTVGVLAFAARVTFATETAPSHLVVIDLDGDGKQDILVTNQYDSSVSILKNNSTPGNIDFLPKVNFPTGYRPLVIDIGDLNNDGLPDIVTGSQDSSIAILTNISTPSGLTFSLQNKLIGVSPRSVAINDIDGDGKPDLCLAGSELNISVLQNTSAGVNITFADRLLFLMTASSSHNKIADINNDGRNDLIVVGGGGQLVVLKNSMSVNLFLCPNATNTFIESNRTGASYQWQVNGGTGYANIQDNSIYSGTNTRFLQISNLTSSWYGLKFRCLVSGIFSDEYVIRFRNSWTGNSGTSWEDPLNWSCMAVPDANTDVSISSGTVTVNSNVTVRSLNLAPAVNFTVSPGYSLTILH